MSEETKITTTEQRVKNPGRVAAGRRLAAISKEAKARKAEERRRAGKEECTGNANLLYVSVGVLGVIGLGYGTYIFLCKKEEPQEKQEQQQEQQPEKKIILMTCK